MNWLNCLTDTSRIKGHSVSLRFDVGAPTHHREAGGMTLNFGRSMNGGELNLLAPEGFMGGKVDRIFSLYAVQEVPVHPTIESMDNPLLPIPLGKLRRFNRSQADQFSAEVKKCIDNLARMFWSYIVSNDSRMDRFEEALRRKK
jgi:hypothetical protein